MNHVVLSGKIVRDIDVRKTASGDPVVNFQLSVRRPGTRDIDDYIDCVAYDATAKNIGERFSVNDWVVVDGFITTHTMKKEAGKVRYTEVKVNSIEASAAE